MLYLERQISRTLHDDHLRTIGVLERLEAVLHKHRAKTAPDHNLPEISTLLADIIGLVEADVKTHFAFEEEHLFTRLAEAGDSPIGELLTQEHNVILPLGTGLGELARKARKDGFTDEEWHEFHRSGMELIERMISHIQKEEMGLLPMLDELIEEDEDADLAAAYAQLG